MVEDNSACVPDRLGYQLCQFCDRHILAHTNVQRLGRVIVLHQKTSCIREIVNVKKFAARRTASPKSDFGFSHYLSLVEPANHRWKNVRRLQIEIITWTIKVCRHEANRRESI